MEKLIILGSGPAGLTAAIYAARSNLEPLIIEGKEPGGQLMSTTAVENWPGEKKIMGPKLMENMRDHAKHFETRFADGNATNITVNTDSFTIETSADKTFETRALIIATGATPKRLEVPGEDDYWGKGVTTCAVCDGAFYKDKPVVIVGGGDTAMEDASFMLNFTKDITIVQILDHLTASEAMKKPVVNNDNITIIYSSTVTEIQGDKGVTGVTIKNEETGETQELEVSAVFIAIGLHPNSEVVKSLIERTASNHIKQIEQTKTSQEGIFAAGDVVDPRYRQAVTSAGMSCMAALDAEKYIKQKLGS